MKESITLPDGQVVTFLQAVTCDGELRGLYHDWVYHRQGRRYKCRRCGQVFEKAHLKELTD